MNEYMGNPFQTAYCERFIFDDGYARGVRGIRVCTGGGLTFVVLPDNGMDIWRAEFQGRNFVWISPCGVKAPAFLEHGDFAWLRSWHGGLLTGTGLQNVGSPCDFQGEHHTLHGRLSNLPAENVNIDCRENGDVMEFEITGTVRDNAVFGVNLSLRRSISFQAGSNEIFIHDTITNDGFRPSPAQILYHSNLGWPLVDKNSVLIAEDHEVVPRNETAAAGLKSWDCAEPAAAGYEEQCFYHDIPAGSDGYACMKLYNPDNKMCFSIRFSKQELPFFTQWKQMGQGEYVMGLEPGTCHPEGLQEEQDKFHSLRVLQPGQSFETHLIYCIEQTAE